MLLPAAFRSTMNVESPCVLFVQLVVGRGAGEEQHEVGLTGAGDKDLLAVDDITVALAHRRGFEAGGLRAGVGLGDAEGLEPQIAASDAGEVAALLLLAAMAQQHAHGVHLGVSGGGVAARAIDLFEDDGAFGHAEAASAVLLGDHRAEPAQAGQLADELLGVLRLLVEVAPVAVGEPGAYVAHRGPDRFEACGGCCRRQPRPPAPASRPLRGRPDRRRRCSPRRCGIQSRARPASPIGRRARRPAAGTASLKRRQARPASAGGRRSR